MIYNMHRCMQAMGICGGHQETLGSWAFPSTVVLRIELRWADLQDKHLFLLYHFTSSDLALRQGLSFLLLGCVLALSLQSILLSWPSILLQRCLDYSCVLPYPAFMLVQDSNSGHQACLPSTFPYSAISLTCTRTHRKDQKAGES